MGLGPLNGGDTKFVPGVPLRTPSRLSVEMLGMRVPGGDCVMVTPVRDRNAGAVRIPGGLDAEEAIDRPSEVEHSGGGDVVGGVVADDLVVREDDRHVGRGRSECRGQRQSPRACLHAE